MTRPQYTLLSNFEFADLEATTTDSGRTYKIPDGQHYPSVTTVLGSIKNEGLENWKKRVGSKECNRIMHHAATRGTAFHEAVERYCKNEKDYFVKNEMPHVKAMFRSIEPELHRIGIIAAIEAPLYSDRLKLAGRVDMIADFDGKPSIVDLKTSSHRKKAESISNYFLQTTAYSLMFEERTGVRLEDLVIIMAVENDPAPLVFKEKRSNWIDQLYSIVDNYHSSKG